MNALAGGGTFATMPSLIALGLPSPIANATSNLALQCGAIASAWAYRRDLEPLGGLSIRTIAIASMAGGVIGAILLVATPTHVFDIVIPWLLLLATLALAFGPKIAGAPHHAVHGGRASLIGLQILLGVYGGYFGGGVGLMMTAIWGILAAIPPHRMSAPRTLTLAAANGAAALVFVTSHMVDWRMVAPMLVGAILGGHYGARLGQLLPPTIIRAITLVISGGMTVIFLVRAYG
jgi:uncharacterized membrane protein YfcA